MMTPEINTFTSFFSHSPMYLTHSTDIVPDQATISGNNLFNIKSFTAFEAHSHHFPIIPLHNRLILPTHPRTKRP